MFIYNINKLVGRFYIKWAVAFILMDYVHRGVVYIASIFFLSFIVQHKAQKASTQRHGQQAITDIYEKCTMVNPSHGTDEHVKSKSW